MARFHFYLNAKVKNGKQLIFLHIFNIGKRTTLSTKEWIKKAAWLKESERVSEPKKIPIPKYNLINRKLSSIKNKAEICYYEAYDELDREPTPHEIKERLLIVLNRASKKEVKEMDLIKYFKKFIQRKNSQLSKNRIKLYNYTLNVLIAVQDSSSIDLGLSKIDFDFYDAFMNFCINKPLGNKTTNSHLARLKAVLREAEEDKIFVNQSFKSRKFKKLPEVEPKFVFLTPNEIVLISKADFSDNERLDNVRDIFIIGCCTGLRYNDLARLKSIHMIATEDGGKILEIVTGKVRKKVSVPFVHPFLNEVLKKRDGQFPKIISEQKTREYLKEICEIVDIKGKIEVVKMIGAELKRESVSRVSKVGLHTSRRSYARNAYKAKVDIEKIRICLGHSSIEQTREYIRITEMENALQLVKHSYYKGE